MGAARSRRANRARDCQARIKLNGKVAQCGPCPRCGGTDRFSVNIKRGVWNCRKCRVGGNVIKLVEHLDGCDFLSACAILTGEPPPKGNGKDTVAEPRKIVTAEYGYEDEAGALVFVVERIEYQNPDGTYVATKCGSKRKKTFRQKRPDPDKRGRWIWNVDGVPALPYRLPELLEALGSDQMILIVEGEAKVDLLRSWNVPATCCAGGAKKWIAEHSEYLSGADVVLLSDNDNVGRKHVEGVAASLQGIATSIRVLNLPDLKEKEDVVDWAARGGAVEQLHELIAREARPWTPQEIADEQQAPELSDDALALTFAERHADDLRFVAFRGRWLLWTSSRWVLDDTLRAFDHARAVCRQAANSDVIGTRTAATLASAKTVAAVERLAKADRRIAAVTEQWDAEPEIFNAPKEEQSP